jgi:hypothetical protein
MSKRCWHYEDAKGVRQEEWLDARQGVLDDQILQSFGTLEKRASEGLPVAVDPFNAIIDTVKAKVEELPPNRGLYWVAELERIGAIKRTPKAAAPAKKEGETGGTK